ncbi:MAG: class I SAM-dependent methyltransferase [Saprospiraceae bacterium]|nr:class I SAM-dependent methyltransferase [Saprospiraceae bacterium]
METGQELNYIQINKEAWNRKVESHFESEFYDVESFINGKNSLTSIELPLLAELTGKRVLHLQCHFGMDSISLARLGAEVVAVDFSEEAIQKGMNLAAQENANVRFICCNVLELDQYLEEQFDIVFASYGIIGWLDDLNQWAKIIAHFLKKDGRFIFAEFHPVVWMFSDRFDSVEFSYFKSEPIIENESGTYADRDADLSTQSMSWNHSLEEVFQALMKNGLSINDFKEYDFSPFNCFLNTEEFQPEKFRIAHFQNKIPMVYSLVAVKN